MLVLWKGYILLYVRRIGQFLDIPSKVALPVYHDSTLTITMAYMGKESAQSQVLLDKRAVRQRVTKISLT